jgi:hypothetical protein
VKEEAEEEVYHYLTDEEIRKISGITFEPVLYFDPGVSDISNDHEKNLQKIIEGLSSKKEIKLRLIALKPGSGSLDPYQKRLLNILDYLKNAGIEGNRIIFSVEQTESPVAGKEPVRIRFYK